MKLKCQRKSTLISTVIIEGFSFYLLIILNCTIQNKNTNNKNIHVSPCLPITVEHPEAKTLFRKLRIVLDFLYLTTFLIYSRIT